MDVEIYKKNIKYKIKKTAQQNLKYTKFTSMKCIVYYKK